MEPFRLVMPRRPPCCLLLVVACVTITTHAIRQIPLLSRFRSLDVGPASTTEGLKNFQGVQFYGEIALGSRQQSILVLFDTGSYETWVPTASFCQQVGPCHSSGFDPTESTTFVFSTQPFQVNYVSGSVRGVYGNDDVFFGNLGSPAAIPLGLVTQQLNMPSQHAFDGLVGMGPNSSFVHALLDAAVADANGERRMFSMYLSDDTTNAGGSLTMGGYDETHLAGTPNSSLVWFPAAPTSSSWNLQYWQLPSAQFVYAGTSLPSTNLPVVIDSGTSFILGPPDAVAMIYRLAGNVDPNTGAIECWRILSLPTFTVIIDGSRINLKPEQYTYRGTDKWSEWIQDRTQLISGL